MIHFIKPEQSLVSALVEASLVGLGWVLTFGLCFKLMCAIGETPSHISIIFIPAGYKLLVSMVLRWRALPGLFFGSLLINHLFFPGYSAFDVMALSSIAAVTGILGVKALERFYYKKNYILDLKLKRSSLLLLSLSYAVVNSLLHNIVFKLSGIFMVRLQDPFRMFTGDFLGVLIFIGLCQAALQLTKKKG